MNLQKLNPWNWFKHEESSANKDITIPVKRNEYGRQLAGQYPLAQFHREMDRLFDEAFQSFGFPTLYKDMFPESGEQLPKLSLFNPDLNISSDDNEYTITVEAAGLEEKDLEINLSESRLIIKGNKQEESENKDKNFYRIERKYGSFQRVLALPDDADADNIKASMKNGLLTICIPRKEKPDSETKTISIEKY